MTIKKRLFWSNIVMTAAPAVTALAVGLCCMGFMWFSFTRGTGIGIGTQEEFERVSLAIAEIMEQGLEETHDQEGDQGLRENREEKADLEEYGAMLEPLLANNGLSLKIFSGEGEAVYEYGEKLPEDDALTEAAGLLGGEVSLEKNGRRLFVHQEEAGGKQGEPEKYSVYLFGGGGEIPGYSDWKRALGLSAAAVFLAVCLTIVLTNRFLTRFVFRRIEEPLRILRDGVHEIRDGNLDYRICYQGKDEFSAVCQDFNEMAVRLKESVERTQREEKSRKELIAGISHDIRSPLTSILAYVEGLIDGVARTSEARANYLEIIREKAQSMARMVSQLFLFSKLELEEYPQNRQMISLDAAIREAVLQMAGECAERGLSVELELASVQLKADPMDVRRIVTNILENSLKYKTEQRGTVRICLRQSGKECFLSLKDDGPGVPEEALDHLFEIFYRTDAARQEPGRGSGLGLAIVAHGVRRMGGSVRALAVSPHGLEIRINIPLEREEKTGGEGYAEDTDYRG